MDDPVGRTLVGAQATLFLVLAAGPWLGPTPAWSGGWWTAVGAALLGLGVALAVAGGARLGPRLTPFPRPRPGHDLVTDGVYRLARHPIYGGVLLVAAGWAALRPAAATVVAAALLWLLLEVKSRYEEGVLRDAHPTYDAYRRGTRRFVPYLY